MSNLDEAVRLAQLALAFGRVERVTLHEDGKLLETDTTHTVMLSLLACSIASWHNEATPIPLKRGRYPTFHFDVGRVAQLALVHDLPEADPECGDTNSFDISDEDREAKEAREDEALGRLIGRHINHNEWLCDTLLEYQEMETPEAQLVKYVDKLCPRLTHVLNGGAAIRAMGVDTDGLLAACDRQDDRLAELYPTIAPIVRQLYQQATELGAREMKLQEGGA